jgi:hypothetical protein
LVAPTITTRSKPWISIAKDSLHRAAGRAIHRPMLGVEMLSVNGWPILHPRMHQLTADYTNAFMEDLAGNSFPATVISALIISFLFSIECHTDEEISEQVRTDSDGAVSAFDLFRSL